MATKEREIEQPAVSPQTGKTTRPPRVKLSAAETLQRMEAFEERKEALIAAVREDKG